MQEKNCLACGKPLWKRPNESEKAFAKRKNCDRKCAGASHGKERLAGVRYESRFGGGWVNAGQFIAEGMCDRLARRDRKTLPFHFWEKPSWKKYFLFQLAVANRLLRRFSAQAVMRALRKHPNCWTLSAEWLKPTLEREQEKWRREQENLQTTPPAPSAPAAVEPPRPPFVFRPSVLSKLREL